jgi:hypothetical protein
LHLNTRKNATSYSKINAMDINQGELIRANYLVAGEGIDALGRRAWLTASDMGFGPIGGRQRGGEDMPQLAHVPSVRIPEHPATDSDHIRPPVPTYSATRDALP